MPRAERFSLIQFANLSMALLGIFAVLLASCHVLLLAIVSVAGWIFELDLRPFVSSSAMIWALSLLGFVVLKLWWTDRGPAA